LKNYLERLHKILFVGKKSLVTATGELSPLYGCTNLTLGIGDKLVDHEVWFSDIKSEGILGVDFLFNNHTKILLKERLQEVGESKIPIEISLSKLDLSCCRIAVSETTTIQPQSEMIVAGAPIEKTLQTVGIIEPALRFITQNNFLAAKETVNPSNKLVPLRVINITDRPITVHKDAVAAFFEPADVLSYSEQSSDDDHNFISSMPEHMTDLYQRSIQHLSEDQQSTVFKLLSEYSDLFSKHSNDIGHTKLVEHHTDTGNEKPIRQTPRRIPFAKRVEAEKKNDMLQNGIIEPSNSPWASPIVLVRKKITLFDSALITEN